ncbi:MAG: hypothetical protein ABI947_07225 [Chloroflexota bacterium]
MYKRKRGEYIAGVSLFNTIWLSLIGVGLCLLMLISVGAMWQWVTEEHFSAPPIPTVRAVQRPAVGPVATSVPVNPNVSLLLPEGARLILSSANGDIFANEANGTAFVKSLLHGSEVTVAPDGRTLAYTRSGGLYIYRAGREETVSISGNIIMPAWNATGDGLAFVLREANGDSVYRVPLDSLQPVHLLTVPEIVAPPLTNPATGRLLIVEKLGAKQTIFYTIDPDCTTQIDCAKSRRDVAMVNRAVNWASYHPNAASLVFSDLDDGNLYLLLTGSGDVQPVVMDSGYKRRPTFNKDGSWLAYVNVTDGGKLYVFRISDKHIYSIPFGSIASLSWVN